MTSMPAEYKEFLRLQDPPLPRLPSPIPPPTLLLEWDAGRKENFHRELTVLLREKNEQTKQKHSQVNSVLALRVVD